MMEYMNVLRRGERTPHRDEVEPLVQLVAPFAPHIAEELWERLGHDGSVFDAGWPAFDAALAAEDAIDARGAGERQDCAARSRSPTDVAQDEAVAAAMADAGDREVRDRRRRRR